MELGQSHSLTEANKALKRHVRERHRERSETIDLITEYNHFTWEMQPAGHFPLVIFWD